MGRKKSAVARAEELEPDDDYIYLYIENPYGMGTGANLSAGGVHLTDISNWIHHMVGTAPGLDGAADVLFSQRSRSGIITRVPVSNRDENKVLCLLGNHRWMEFVDTTKSHVLHKLGGAEGVEKYSTVFISTLQNEDDISGKQWIRVNLPTKIPHYPDFKLGSYPRPHLPLTPTQGHAIGRALPVARPLTPPPPSEAPSAPPIRDDASKQAAFQPEWDMLQADLSSSSGANAHPNAAAAAKRDQEMAIKDELTLMEINTMRANDERDRLAAAARASAGDDSTAFKPKAEEPIEEDTKPNLEQSIEQELALMERLDERRARKALSEDVSPKVEQSVEQEHVASEPVRKPSADRHEARNIRPDVEEDTAIEQGTTQDASASGTPRLVKSEDGPVPQSSTGLGVKREADEETGTIVNKKLKLES